MAQTFEVSENTRVEVLSTFTAANQFVDAVADEPAWWNIGAFYFPYSTVVSIELIGLVSDAGVELKARLFDVAAAAPVSGTETEVIDGTTPERVLSGAVDLPGGKVYQMQAQCIGDPGEMGVIHSAQLV